MHLDLADRIPDPVRRPSERGGDANAYDLHPLVHEDAAGGLTSAVITPAFGGTVIALCHQARDWQWPMPILESADVAAIALKPTSYGIPLLGPTPGRVGTKQSGDFAWAGAEHRIVPTRHGFLRDLAWTVETAGKARMTCYLEIEPSAALGSFPYRFRVRHEISLGASKLTSRVSIDNIGEIAQPIDIGWHPYLHNSGECCVRLPASHQWELDGALEPVPTGRLIPVAGASDFREGRTTAAGHHTLELSEGSARGGLLIEGRVSFLSGVSMQHCNTKRLKSLT